MIEVFGGDVKARGGPVRRTLVVAVECTVCGHHHDPRMWRCPACESAEAAAADMRIDERKEG
jgi:lipopolysaccharide biosynthesis regulator YciM